MKRWPWVIAILLVGLFQVGCRRFMASEIRSSPEYNLGMNTFRNSSKGRELIGDHVVADENRVDSYGANSYIVGGNGHSELVVPVSGSIRKGSLYIKATEKSGQWHIDDLQLRLDGQSTWIKLPSESR